MSRSSKKKSKSKFSLFVAIVFLAVLFYGIYLLFLKNTSVNPSSNTNTTISNSNEVVNQTENQTETPAEEVKEEDIKEDTSIKMTVMGDIMCHNSQYMDAYNSKTKKYNFDYVFKDVKDKLSNSDLTIGNLETTFAGAKIRI